MLQDGNDILVTPKAIENHLLDHFRSIIKGRNACTTNSMIAEVNPNLVIEVDNNMLTTIPLAEEVKNVVFDLNLDGAAGPDGFGVYFYQFFWTIVASDVILSVQEFFQTGIILPNLISNISVLIPKVKGASSMGDFRPIAFPNFHFKIITEILADILAIATTRIISENQRGFIRVRHISDYVIIASEVINLLDKWQFGGNLALKIDIRKAFDTLD